MRASFISFTGGAWIIVMMLGAPHCAISKPCTESGDISWEHDPPFEGDQHCVRIKDRNGNWVNHGKYYRYYTHRREKVALEGQFVMGEKDGLWIEYDEDGKEVKRVYFTKGKVDENPPPQAK